MNIRKATVKDFNELYELGRKTPELQVSATEEFMDPDEFKWSITNKDCVFLVAEEHNKLIGFIYANAKDAERPFKNKYACIVYIVVSLEYRKKGVAIELYNECEKIVKEMGIQFLYGWANETSGVIEFLKKQGFNEGHSYKWMDKKIN